MITFFDRNPILCSAWNVYLKDVGFPYQIKQCNFLDLEPHEYLVNAGNSFGLMDGGIDYYISEYWKKENPESWKEYVKDVSEFVPLPIGKTMTFYAGTPIFRSLCLTPTMVWPEDISETFNVFYATLGAISEIGKFSLENHTTAICGLGTGCGNVSPIDCAKQMNAAFKYYNSVKTGGWDDVTLLKQILGEI
jgi:O-acetyl-ADP-ribose deacetylase (regulator of RNase III)